MYKFLSRSVTKSHSGTLNFTNICRKVSKTHNKSCSILKRSMSDSSIKSDIAIEETAEETNSEQKAEELKDTRSSVLKNYRMLKKSLFAERPRDLTQIRKFRTSSATYFFSSGIYQSKKSPKSGYPNFRVAETYRKAMEQCLKIKNQKKRNDHPFTNESLHPKPVKFEILASELSKNTGKIESKAKIPKKKQAISTKQILQEMMRYKKTVNIDHPKQKEPFRIVYPMRKIREKTGISVNSLKSDRKVSKKRTKSEDKLSTNSSYKIAQLYSKEKEENHYANQRRQDITNAKMILNRYAVTSEVPVKEDNKLANILMGQREREKMQKQDDKNNDRNSIIKEKRDIQNHPILFPEEPKINLDQNNIEHSDNITENKTNKYVVEDVRLRSVEDKDYDHTGTARKLDEQSDGFEEQQISKNIEELLKRNNDRMSKSEDSASSNITNYIKELNDFKEQSAIDKCETKKRNEMIEDESEEIVKKVEEKIVEKNNLLENFGKSNFIPAKIFNGNKEKLQNILLKYKCEEPEQTLEVVNKKPEKSQSQRANRTVQPSIRKTNSENKFKSLPALPTTPVSKYIRKIKENNNKDKKEKNVLVMEESPISTSVLLERVKQASKLKSPRTTPEVREKDTVSKSDPAVVSQNVQKIVAPALYKKVKLAEEIKIRASNYANKSKPNKVAEFKNELTPYKEENVEKVSEKIVVKENDEVIPLKLFLKEYPPATTSQKLITDSNADSKKLLEENDVENEKRELENEEKSGFEENSKQEKEVLVKGTKFPRVRGRVFPKRYSQLNLKKQIKEENRENSGGLENKNLLEPKNNQSVTKDKRKETFLEPIPREEGAKTYKDLHLKKEATRKNRFVFKNSKLILTQKKSATQSDLQQKNKTKKRNPRLRNRREANNVVNKNNEVKEQEISPEENSNKNKPVMCSKVIDLNESNPPTTNDVSTSYKTFNDSYFLNFKHANRAQKQDVVERFQSGENMTDDISQEDANNMTGRIDVVDHFHLLKEVANKARERLKFYDKKVTSKEEDVSVEQPFIRKEIPRPTTKRDDKAKKDPPKPKTGIILPPPKNQEGTKLDDEVVKSKPPTDDKLIYKSVDDLRKLIAMEGDGKYRENLKYIVALIEDIKIDYKDGSDPNLIKLAQEFDVENQKKSVQIISNIEKDPTKSIKSENKAGYETIQENNCKDILEKLNESTIQETLSQKSSVRRQPLPTHIVRKLMKIKRQRDRRKQYDRTEEYEKFFNVVTNPQEATIQKPVLKLNHSDSSLMKMYLMEDDSNTESFMIKKKNRPTTSDRNQERPKDEVEGVPNTLVAEKVLRSLKRPEKFINDAAVKPKLTKEKLLNSDVGEKTESKLKPINFLAKATPNTTKNSKKDAWPVKKSSDPLNKVNFKKICENSMKNNKPKFNVTKKIENVSSNQKETDKKSVVFVLTKSSPTIKSISEKFQPKKLETNKNSLESTSKSMPSIEDGKKDSKTKALIEEFEKKSNESVGKHKNKILQLEQCFNRIVKNLKKLDERGQLVKSVVANVNGMVYKCTNKFLEEIFELKEVKKQKEVGQTNKFQLQPKQTEDKQESEDKRYSQTEETKPKIQEFKNLKTVDLDNDVMTVIKKSLFADDLLKKADQKTISNVYTSKLQSSNASNEVVEEVDADKNLNLYNFKDVSDNQQTLEGKPIAVNDEKLPNALATLKGDNRVKNCNTILKENNIVKIIVQTQNANIVISSNTYLDPKLTESNEPSRLKIAVDKEKSKVGKKSLESQFEEANTMKKLVSEAVKIIGDMNISNKVLDVQKNDSQFLYKNVFANLDALKMPEIFNGDRIKASDQLFKTSSKTSTKSLEQLNKEDCTRYCFAEYDYSYAKRRAKKQLDKKLCKLDTEDGLCFKAYFSSVEKRTNKTQERSPSIKFHKKKGNKRSKSNFNCNYSTMSKMDSLFEGKKLEMLSDKGGDKPDKPSDKKMPKENDKNKKSDKSSKKTVFKIIRAPNIYRAGRRYTKSIKLKSKNRKTEAPKKSTNPTYHGRRNVILYLLQNQFNNKINKANLKSERKLNPKEEVEKTVDKFKVDVTHDNDTDFHTVSLTDTELYKEKRLRDNRYKNRMSKTKTSVNINKESKNIKNYPDENVNKSNDKIIKRPASKYLLENQANLYKKYSRDFKGSLKERILEKQSVLKSTISQKSTSEHSETENKNKKDEGNKIDDKKPPKASLNDEPTKPETFKEILDNELNNIFENGPPDYKKLVAKVEEIVDNNSKLHKFNKNLSNYNKNKIESNSSHNLRISEITIEKDLENIQNIPPQVARETFAISKKDCEIVRIPTKSLFQTIYSLPSENDTTLTKRNNEKIMSVRKSGFRRYPGTKITYVAANKGNTDISPGHFSPRKSKINLLKEVEADTRSIISARFELLKTLQDEFNKLHSIGTNLELNQAEPSLNKSENQSQECKDAASFGADDTCLEKGSNQSLIDDKMTDFSSNSDSKPKVINNLESILRTWINRFSSVYENDKKNPNK